MKLRFPKSLGNDTYNDYLKDLSKRKRLEKNVNSIAPVGTYSETRKSLKQGKFTRLETATILVAIRTYLKVKKKSFKEFLKCGRKKWKEFVSCFCDRSIQMIHDHITRKFGGWKHGPWSDGEVKELLDLVKIHGRRWKKISSIVGRHPEDIHSKYSLLGDFTKQALSQEETKSLLNTIRDLCNLSSGATLEEMASQKIPWNAVTETLGKRRKITYFNRFRALITSKTREKKMQAHLKMFISPKIATLSQDILMLQAIQESGAESDSEMKDNLKDYHYSGRLRLRNLQRICPNGMPFTEKIRFLIKDRETELIKLQFGTENES